jgi:hypothetical protein
MAVDVDERGTPLDLAMLDARPEVVDRILERARHRFVREAGLARHPARWAWAAVWDRAEPVLAGAWVGSYLLWALAQVVRLG